MDVLRVMKGYVCSVCMETRMDRPIWFILHYAINGLS